MIPRHAYSMLMQGAIDKITHATEHHGPEAGIIAIKEMVMLSYEVNTDRGRCEVIDVTDKIIEQMGALWQPFADLGIVEMSFVSVYIEDHLVAQAGQLRGDSDEPFHIVNERFDAIPVKNMKAFARYTALAMREHGINSLAKIANEDPDVIEDGFTKLIREFLDEELEETVNEFQAKLDRVFGVGDLLPAATWAPPKGGESHDMPPPG